MKDSSDSRHIKGLSADTPEFQLGIYDSIRLVKDADWDAVISPDDVYLRRDYLRSLEEGMSDTMEFRYVIYYSHRYEPIGVAYFQAVDLVDNGSQYRDALKKLGGVLGQRIIREMKLRSLVCGNVFHCGDHGFRFLKAFDTRESLEMVHTTMERLRKGDRFDSKVSISLFKEFWPEQFKYSDELVNKRYHSFPMDDNMVMDIRSEWTDTETYLESLTSKARTRYRSILKKSSHLEIRAMSAAEILEVEDDLEALFEQVIVHSQFIFGRLRMKVYAAWKETLADRMIFHGFFLEGRLVGFNSAFVLGRTLDVHYVGIDYSVNKEHMLYQRMLTDLLELAIEEDFDRLNFGRTAEQAKSVLGALPVRMLLYTKHRNSIANRLIRPLMSSVEASPYELRSPFKRTEV